MERLSPWACAVLVLLLGACNPAPGESDPVQPSETKADDPSAGDPTASYPIRLERATPQEVAAHFSVRFAEQLDACFAHYVQTVDAQATVITAEVLQGFRSTYPYDGSETVGTCYETYDLMDVINKLFALHAVSEAEPETIKRWFEPWAVDQLQAAVVDGAVVGAYDLVFYDDVQAVQDENAIKREKAPTGIDLGALRAAWREVQTHTTLDREYFNPVILDPTLVNDSRIFAAMKEAFPVSRLELYSWGRQAIDDFWQSVEGPEGDPAFEPIAQQLKQRSITKRFYFAGGGYEPFGWSRNIVLVYDEHGQMFGMMMGYSE